MLVDEVEDQEGDEQYNFQITNPPLGQDAQTNPLGPNISSLEPTSEAIPSTFGRSNAIFEQQLEEQKNKFKRLVSA